MDWTAVFPKLAELARRMKANPHLHEYFQEMDPGGYEELLKLQNCPFINWRPFGELPKIEMVEDRKRIVPGFAQAGLLACKNHEKWGQAGNRAGKTAVGLFEDLCDMLGLNPLTLKIEQRFTEHVEDGISLWIVSDTEETSINIIQRTLVTDFFGEDQTGVMWNLIQDSCSYDKENGFKNNILTFTNKSWIQFKFTTQKRTTFQGVPKHKIHHDEVQPKDIYDECKARLTDFLGRFLGTMTPIFDEKKGIPWIYEELYQKRHQKRIDFFRWSMLDNPHLSVASKKQYIQGLDDDEISSRVHGLFVPVGVKLAFRAKLLDRLQHTIQLPVEGDLSINEEGQVEFLRSFAEREDYELDFAA